MSTMTENGTIVYTMQQRAEALLDIRDCTLEGGKPLISEELEAVFDSCLATGPENSLRARVTNDPNYERLNARQKAFILAEIDLRDCPVRVGDKVQMLCERPDGALYNKGDVDVVTSTDFAYVGTGASWLVSHRNYRLVPPLEFPPDPGVTGVDYATVRRFATNVATSFMRHTDESGDWGTRSCNCRVVMEGVDYAAAWFREGRGIFDEGVAWSGTPDGKRWMGEVVRWMRAFNVDRFHRGRTVQEAPAPEVVVPEPMPERDLSAPAPDPQLAATVAALEADVQRLQRERDRMMAERDALTVWQERAKRDAEIMSEVLNDEATSRDWCSEYEGVVERINNRTRVLELTARTREVEVTIRGFVRVPFSFSYSVEVSSGDDAEEMASNEVTENYSARDLVRDHANWYDAEFEIEEAEAE